MAEASGGKPDIPPSKEGDAGGDSDHPDDSSSEFLEPGEVADSSASDGESSADETDSTAGDFAKHDLKVRRFAIISDLSEEDQEVEHNNVKEYGSFAKPGTKHETATSYLGIPLKKWVVHFYPTVATKCKEPPTKATANEPSPGWELLARQNKGATKLFDPADQDPVYCTFLPLQCCPVIDCPYGPNQAYPVDQQGCSFTAAAMVRHWTRWHMARKPYAVCRVCSSVFLILTDFQSHLLNNHVRTGDIPPKMKYFSEGEKGLHIPIDRYCIISTMSCNTVWPDMYQQIG